MGGEELDAGEGVTGAEEIGGAGVDVGMGKSVGMDMDVAEDVDVGVEETEEKDGEEDVDAARGDVDVVLVAEDDMTDEVTLLDDVEIRPGPSASLERTAKRTTGGPAILQLVGWFQISADRYVKKTSGERTDRAGSPPYISSPTLL